MTILRLKIVFQLMRLWDEEERKIDFLCRLREGTVIPKPHWNLTVPIPVSESSPQKYGEAGIQ